MTTQPKVMSGSYQDYLTGNTANKKFQFRLIRQNTSSSFVDSKGRPRLYPTFFDFQAYGIVNELIDNKWTQRVIRYIPGEPSIYKDEQSSDEKIPKKLFKIRLERGVKTVHATDRLLLDFMMKCNINATNPNRKLDVEAEFELVDTDKAIKKAMADDEALDEAKYFCRKGEWEKVRALAMVLGVRTDLTTDETRWNLRTIAERDPAKFLTLEKDPKTVKKYHVMEAIDKGFLIANYASNSIAWVTNQSQPIYTAVIGRDVVDGLVNQLSTIDGALLYEAITSLLYPQKEEVVKVSAPTRGEIQAVKMNVTPRTPMLPEAIKTDEDIKAMIEKSITEKLIITSGTLPWITYSGQKFKGKSDFMLNLKSNESMLKSFIELTR